MKPVYILGIHEGHNCSACLMVNGTVVAAANEERFTGIKNEVGYPKHTIDYCLSFAGITAADLDKVAVSTINQNLVWSKIRREAVFKIDDYVFEQHHYFQPLIIEKKDPAETLWRYLKAVEARKGVQTTHYDFSQLSKKNLLDLDYYKQVRINAIVNHLGIDPVKISYINHHRCHQYFAYFSSPFREKTLILTADGVGDFGVNATVSVANDNHITTLAQSTNCQVARIYRYITLLLGMKPLDHEYKVMGLAPYANSKETDRAYSVFSDILKVDGLRFRWNHKPSDLYFHFASALQGCRFDGIAGAVQKMTEAIISAWAKNALTQTRLQTLVFAGGVAMNIKVNMLLAQMPQVKKFFVGPSPADESNAIGACYFAMADYCRRRQINSNIIAPITHAYLGPGYSPAQVSRAITSAKLTSGYRVKHKITHRYIAKQLAAGKIIGICRGRLEFGARALGNRSILADPSHPDIVRKLNQSIKFRDFWMPFTPSILYEKASDYVINPKHLYLPYMTVGLDTTPKAHRLLAAAIHPADLTARPQMVKRATNPDYYDLIKEFSRLTGIGAVLNTSFNLHGFPIVNTPEDALFTFKNSGLDILYFGDLCVERV